MPPTLLQCAPEPAPPASEEVTELESSEYQLALIAAGADCRDKLHEVKDLLK